MLHFLFLSEIYRDGLPKVHFFHTLVQISEGVLTHLSQACKNRNNQKLRNQNPRLSDPNSVCKILTWCGVAQYGAAWLSMVRRGS